MTPRFVFVWLSAIMVTGCGSAEIQRERLAPEPLAQQESSDEHLVKFDLIADTSRVAAGQEITIGGHFSIAADWHIYWINPGDSGLATELKLFAPSDVSMSPVQWPGPKRFDLPGDIVNYGYENQVTLWATVQTPDSIAEDGLSFRAEASWLACREACVKGSTKAEITIPVASEAAPAEPLHRDRFERAVATTPVPLQKNQPGSYRSQGETTIEVLKFADASNASYFPLAKEPLIGSATLPKDGGIELQLSYKNEVPEQRGVIAVTDSQGTRFFSNTLPIQEK